MRTIEIDTNGCRRLRRTCARLLRWPTLAGVCGLAALALMMAMGGANAQSLRSAPEQASGYAARSLAVAERFMVSAANPEAVDAGVEMLRAGGSAVDAAIAVQLVLNLVEPQSSGIGGGAFLVHWDPADKTVSTYDGRETAPMAARPDRFIKNGRYLPFREAVHSGLSVGVPGLVKLLHHVHRRHGRLPWARLFEPAISLATRGFSVSPRLNILLRLDDPQRFAPAARRYFYDESGAALAVGVRRTNLAFAATLRAIARDGPKAFYRGPVAQAIVDAVRSAPNHAGDVTLADLSAYDVVTRPPVCSTYRGYRICGMGPPSSGAITVAQTLGLIEGFDVGDGPTDVLDPGAVHVIAEAQKLAYADRNRYLADPDHVRVPKTLLDAAYLRRRATLIDVRRAMAKARPGIPPDVRADAFGIDATRESVGTSHISVVDGDGHAVSMTTTIESAFGSRLWAAGFLLNNELTDFSFRPRDATGRAIANAVGPGKRPRSSMAPTLVFKPDGRFHAALGSPGGSSIILYVTKALIAMIDWKLDPQAATEVRNFGSRGGALNFELNPAITTGDAADVFARRPSIWYALQLRGLGHRVRTRLMTSGLHIVMRDGDRLLGGADPRREGVARGD